MNKLFLAAALGAAIVSAPAIAQGAPRPQAADAAGHDPRQAQQFADIDVQAARRQSRTAPSPGGSRPGAAQQTRRSAAHDASSATFGTAQSLTLRSSKPRRWPGSTPRTPTMTASSRPPSASRRARCGRRRSVSAALGRDEHPQEHGDGARHADLAFEPQADRRARHADRLGEVVLGAVAEAAHRRCAARPGDMEARRSSSIRSRP